MTDADMVSGTIPAKTINYDAVYDDSPPLDINARSARSLAETVKDHEARIVALEGVRYPSPP